MMYCLQRADGGVIRISHRAGDLVHHARRMKGECEKLKLCIRRERALTPIGTFMFMEMLKKPRAMWSQPSIVADWKFVPYVCEGCRHIWTHNHTDDGKCLFASTTWTIDPVHPLMQFAQLHSRTQPAHVPATAWVSP
jgi:hypothetical protein